MVRYKMMDYTVGALFCSYSCVCGVDSRVGMSPIRLSLLVGLTLLASCLALKCHLCDSNIDRDCLIEPDRNQTCQPEKFCTNIYYKIPILNGSSSALRGRVDQLSLITRGQSNLTKSASQLGVNPGGRKLYH